MTERDCCTEYASLSRRGLLAGALAIGGASTMVGSAMVTSSASAATPAPAVLVVVSLRGACDGLSLVVPHADPIYYAARPTIAIPAAQLLAPDPMFGLHPGLAPLLPLWQSGRMAAVHATGLPAPNRSHFAAMEEIEDADPGSTARSGWLNRLVGELPGMSPLQGISLAAGAPPTALYGRAPTMSAGDVDDVDIAGHDKWDTDGRRLTSLHTLWDHARSPLARAMRSTFAAVAEFAPARAVEDTPAGGAVYPTSDLGKALSQVARVIKGDVGVGVLTVDQGDWDMHADLGTLSGGRMRNNVEDLARSLAAFFTDIGTFGAKTTVVTLSEFGRRVEENSSAGLDHGYGNVMFVAGAGVKGGQYFGSWPGLSRGLDADLLVTTDYRSVLAEVVRTRFGASTAQVFPGFSAAPVGVMLGA